MRILDNQKKFPHEMTLKKEIITKGLYESVGSVATGFREYGMEEIYGNQKSRGHAL